MDSVLIWIIVGLVALLLLMFIVFFILINLKTIKRNWNTLTYYTVPSIFALAALLATRDYSSWSAFGLSFIKPYFHILGLTLPNLLSITLTIFAVWRLVKLSLALNGIRLYKKFINFIDESNAVIVVDGTPGTGKSSSTSEYCVLLSELMWDKVKYDYWLLRNTQHRWRGDNKLELDLKDNKSSYEYWNADESYYPCLFSNVDSHDLTNNCDSGVTVDGRKVRLVTFEMLNKQKYIPYGSVIHAEELGDWMGNKFSDKEGKEFLKGVSQVVGRFPRHFGLRFVINDQDCTNLYIDARRGVTFNQLMLQQTWYCRPKLLLFIQSVLKWFVVKFKYRNTKLFARFMLFLNKYIKSIGFRRYVSEIRGNTQHGRSKKSGSFVFCIPSMLLASFDDRYKRAEYTVEECERAHREYEQLKAESIKLANIACEDMQAVRRYKDKMKLAKEIQEDADLREFIKNNFP